MRENWKNAIETCRVKIGSRWKRISAARRLGSHRGVEEAVRREQHTKEKTSSERFPVLMLVNLLINVSLTVPVGGWSAWCEARQAVARGQPPRESLCCFPTSKTTKQEEARRRGRRGATGKRAFSVRREISQPGRGPMPVNSVGRSLTR